MDLFAGYGDTQGEPTGPVCNVGRVRVPLCCSLELFGNPFSVSGSGMQQLLERAVFLTLAQTTQSLSLNACTFLISEQFLLHFFLSESSGSSFRQLTFFCTSFITYSYKSVPSFGTYM